MYADLTVVEHLQRQDEKFAVFAAFHLLGEIAVFQRIIGALKAGERPQLDVVVELGDAVVDVSSRKIETYILVGNRAWNAALNADESLLFVANGLSDDVSIINVADRKVIKSVPVGRVPYMVLVDN